MPIQSHTPGYYKSGTQPSATEGRVCGPSPGRARLGRDTVGAGIYSGTVQRDAHGAVVIGKQYQNHNARPGPVYR